jgi:hypothetical protein
VVVVPDIPDEAVEAAPQRCNHGKTVMEFCQECSDDEWGDEDETLAEMAERYARRAVVAEAENARLRAQVEAIAKERDNANARWRQDQWFVGDEPKLKAENARLRKALQRIVAYHDATSLSFKRISVDVLNIAAAALSDEGKPDD